MIINGFTDRIFNNQFRIFNPFPNRFCCYRCTIVPLEYFPLFNLFQFFTIRLKIFLLRPYGLFCIFDPPINKSLISWFRSRCRLPCGLCAFCIIFRLFKFIKASFPCGKHLITPVCKSTSTTAVYIRLREKRNISMHIVNRFL